MGGFGAGPDPIKDSLKKRMKAGGVDKIDPSDNTSTPITLFQLHVKGNQL